MKVEFKENTKRFIKENNCHYTVSTESIDGIKTRYGIVIENSSGSVLLSERSWELETVLDMIESKIVEEQKEVLKDRVTSVFDKAYSEYKVDQDIAQILSDHIYDMFSLKKETV